MPVRSPDQAERRRGRLSPPSGLLSASAATAAGPVASTTAAVAAWRALRALARRCVLRPLDQLLRLDERPVLVLGDELQANAATLLVDLLHDHVQDVAPVDHVLDVADASGAHVRN